MTAQEIQKRNEKAQHLRVIQVDDVWYYVESEEQKICYKVCFVNEGEVFCTCADYARGSKTDPNFRCKHILAVMQCVPQGEFEASEYLEKRRPKLDERFITTIEGKDFVYYAGLLDLAHQKSLLKMEVEAIQYPNESNQFTAICSATAHTSYGGIFSDIGDASPNNCNFKVAKHLLRMASTRAKARALRDLTNIGMTCLEELGDLSEVIGSDEKGKTQEKRTAAKRTEKAVKPEKKVETAKPNVPAEAKKSEEVKTQAPVSATPVNDKPAETKAPAKSNGNGKGKSKENTIPQMSSAQKNAIYNLSRRRGISVEELESMVTKSYGVNLEALSSQDASSFIRQLQQSA
jgi:predicted nucleic acid-binding Zn finger protein